MLRSRKMLEKAATQALLASGLLASAAFTSTGFAQAIPSFSGAEGAGMYTTGGRGGVVYHVTQLDTGYGQSAIPGTLQYGLNDSNFAGGARTIVFDVGGTIWFGRNATDTEGWDTQDRISVGSNITIAGQTAPGGINILGGTLKANGNNAIYRNLVIAPGYGTRGIESDGIPDANVYDAMNIHATGVMIDHVSCYFGTDETISADEFAYDVSLQYSNLSQGQNYPNWDTTGGYTGHAFGSLWQPNSNAKTTISHNLYAHQKGRLPRFGSTVGSGALNDFRNNVVYNWFGTAGTGASGQPSFSNFVGNFYLTGLGGENSSGATKGSPIITQTAGGTSVFNGNDTANTRIYHLGNVKDTNHDGDANDGVALTNSDFGSSTFVASPYATGWEGVTDTAAVAYSRVLDYAGANWWARNAIDARLINETRTGTGQIVAWADPTHGTEWNALLALKPPAGGGIGGTGIYARGAGYDTDNDGMPNAWEATVGLNPSLADNNGDYDADGYTNLEEYLNEVAEWPAPQPIIFTGATNGRYEQITNWDIKWQPSRFDEAQIQNGDVTLNSVGQHARVLKIAPNAGNVATLAVSGMIAVEQQLSIGAGGTVTQTAGAVTVPILDVKGIYNLNGGNLNVANVQLSGTGLVKLASGADKTLRMTTLTVANTAKLDVRDNQLIVTGMPAGDWNGSVYTGVAGLVAAGRNGGAWNGAGIITSEPLAASQSTTLAVATAAQAGYVGGLFGGYTVAATDVLVMYTYAGDANLDGKITADDYFQIDAHYGKTGASNLGYFNGDFNYSGQINGDDYFLIDQSFAATHPGAALPAGVQIVPEPACLAALAAATFLLTRRRRFLPPRKLS